MITDISSRLKINDEQIQRIDDELAKPGLTSMQREVMMLWRDSLVENNRVIAELINAPPPDPRMAEIVSEMFHRARFTSPFMRDGKVVQNSQTKNGQSDS